MASYTVRGNDWTRIPGTTGSAVVLTSLDESNVMVHSSSGAPVSRWRPSGVVLPGHGNLVFASNAGEDVYLKCSDDGAAYVDVMVIGAAPGSIPGYKGAFPTLAALKTAYPASIAGDFAYVGPDKSEWSPVANDWVNTVSQVLMRDVFTPTSGQTVFSLTAAPSEPATVTFFVRGNAYLPTVDFTIAGAAVTWLNNGFTLNPSDTVAVLYT